MVLKEFISPKGLPVIIRHAKEEDADAIMKMTKATLSTFPEFVLTKPEEFNMTLQQEKEWIRSHNFADTSFLAVAETDSNIIGIVHMEVGKKKKIAHSGEFAIGLHPAYTDQKAGTALLECLIEWAKANPKIERVILNVNESNERAIHLYKKFGFVKEARNIKAIKLSDGRYLNNIQMALFV